MIRKYNHNNITWVDLENPTSEEIRSITAEYELSDLVGQDLLSPTLRSKVDIYPNFVYLILHIPSTNRIAGIQEIDFVIGKKFIITTRYEEIDPLLEFSKIFEIDSILNKDQIGTHAGFVFFYMMRTIYRSLLEKLDFLESDLIKIEQNIFAGHERKMVTELSQTARTLLNFKTATDNHEAMLESLEAAHTAIFGNEFHHYIRNIQGEAKKVRNAILSKRDYIDELRDTNDSLLTSKQNEIMKVFTILAFVTFPLSLIIDIVGIPSAHNPILGNPNDFWIIVGITIVVLASMVMYFKKKEWL